MTMPRPLDVTTTIGTGTGIGAWLATNLDLITGAAGAAAALIGLAVAGVSLVIKLYHLAATRRAFREGRLHPPDK